MNQLIFATMPLFCVDQSILNEYCKINIDKCSYIITHQMEKNEIERIYLEGKMDAYEDILNFIAPR